VAVIRVELADALLVSKVELVYRNVNRPDQGRMACQHLKVSPWSTDCRCGQAAHASHKWNAVCRACGALLNVEGL
jgi:hypothetical protein